MAGDWISFDHDLPDKAEVLAICVKSGASLGDTILRLCRFWCWIDRHTTDGTIPGVGVSGLCMKCGGDEDFWRAVENVGWLVLRENDVFMPNYNSRLGATARSRMLTTKRVQSLRSRYNGVTKPLPKAHPLSLSLSLSSSSNEEGENFSCGRFSFSTWDIETAKWMHACNLELQPDRKEPHLEAWANEVRLMRERDGREGTAIRELYQWCHDDSFWCQNVLSPTKLREKWDDLQLRRKKSKSRTSSRDNTGRPDAPGRGRL